MKKDGGYKDISNLKYFSTSSSCWTIAVSIYFTVSIKGIYIYIYVYTRYQGGLVVSTHSKSSLLYIYIYIYIYSGAFLTVFVVFHDKICVFIMI